MLYIVTLLIIFYTLNILHTLGHLIAAKLSGVQVTELNFGLPPKIFKKEIGGTNYSFNLFPLFGYVKVKREEGVNGSGFLDKSRFTQSLISVSGVLMNLFIAFIAFFFAAYLSPAVSDTNIVKIMEVMPDSPAEQAGLEQGDIILSLNNKLILSNEDFITSINKEVGNEVSLIYEDETTGNQEATTLIPLSNPPEGQGATGVVITTGEYYDPPFLERIVTSIKDSLLGIIYFYQDYFSMILDRGSRSMSGPILWALLTRIQEVPEYILMLENIGYASLRIFLYLMPLPFVAGGNLLLIFLESVTGKEFYNREKEEIVMI